MFKAKINGDVDVLKCKNIGSEVPLGYEKTETYFVDNSGFGTRGESALILQDFLSKVKSSYYYGISFVGQFQVYISEFKKIAKSRKDVYKENGIAKSKLIRRHTRLTEYADGTKKLRFWNTDIITWTNKGTMILNSGGYRTNTTKERLSQYVNIYQKDFTWYVVTNKGTENEKTLDFMDGMEI
jgi:hypothetical protein